MATQQLVDRAERTTAELTEAARENFAEAERYARRAAEAASEAAEVYAARASETAHVAAERLGERAGDLRDDVEDLWDDPETRPYLVGALAGIGLTGLAIWLWRRRAKRKEREYESSVTEVSGWQDPREALDTADAG